MRPARLLAVARRDLAMETKGLRGVAVPVLFGVLLLPIAAIPVAEQRLATIDPVAYVDGDVPPEVAALPNLRVGPHPSAVTMRRDADGTLHARAAFIPPHVRAVLDGDDAAAVKVAIATPEFYIPRRTFWLALLTASILVGAVSEALPGERSRKTFETLLTAGITRLELMGGKVLAWGGLGALATLLAAAIAVALGNMPLGLWILPLPLVPLCTVAVGFWFVRRAGDVIGASTVTVRIVPAILGGLGLLAWAVSIVSPAVAAAIPLGGALLAAGDTWPGPVPPLVATLSTGLTTALLVALTARDLDADPIGRESIPGPLLAAAGFTAAAATAHFTALVGPVLWGLAGNQGLTDGLLTGPGVQASSMLLLLIVAVAAARETDSFAALGLRMPTPADALAVGAGTIGVVGASFASWPANGVIVSDVARRLGEGLFPAQLGTLLLAAVAQELLFRGALPRLAGPIAAGVASVLVLAPLDPVRGVAMGVVLGAVAHYSGSSGNAVMARVLGALIVALMAW